MSNISTNDHCLRQWQINALPGYLDRLGQKAELTAAYQGTGKTIYAATCFVASVLNETTFKNLPLKDIKRRFRYSETENDFVIVFIPSLSILESTISSWELLGVDLIHLENSKIEKTSLDLLIKKGYSGLVCTYQQAVSNGYSSSGEWKENTLINLIKSHPKIRIHGVLDECHELTTSYEGEPKNLRAKFFAFNRRSFYKLHLLTGTPVKQGWKIFQSDDIQDSKKKVKRILFLKYANNGDVIPDTLYSQEDAIRDRVIVQTVPIIHSVESYKVKIDNQEYCLTLEDIEWYMKEYNPKSSTNSNHPNYKRLRVIHESYIAVCSSIKLWEELLKSGDSCLTKTRGDYPDSMGIIFAPSQDAAINIHKNLLPFRSVLCIGEDRKQKENLSGCSLVGSRKIRSYLSTKKTGIDWIVTCEALMQGFDYPDCKVSIILPRLQFLHLTKIAQIIGRTNRTIKGHPDLMAFCITLNYKPIEELVKLSQKNSFGICQQPIYNSDIIDLHSLEVIQNAKERARKHGKGEQIVQKKIEILDLMLSAKSKIVVDGKELFQFDKEILQQLTEENIRTYWTLYSNIVHGGGDLNPEQEPPEEAGAYILVNAKTATFLYVGSGSDLRRRVKTIDRYDQFWWIPEEGEEHIYITWIVTDNYLDQEDYLKHILKPKYDGEKPRTKSRERWKYLWDHFGWNDGKVS